MIIDLQLVVSPSFDFGFQLRTFFPGNDAIGFHGFKGIQVLAHFIVNLIGVHGFALPSIRPNKRKPHQDLVWFLFGERERLGSPPAFYFDNRGPFVSVHVHPFSYEPTAGSVIPSSKG